MATTALIKPMSPALAKRAARIVERMLCQSAFSDITIEVVNGEIKQINHRHRLRLEEAEEVYTEP